MACLQRTVVAAERLLLPPPGLARALQELLLPLGHDLIKLVHARDMPQVRGVSGPGLHSGVRYVASVGPGQQKAG